MVRLNYSETVSCLRLGHDNPNRVADPGRRWIAIEEPEPLDLNLPYADTVRSVRKQNSLLLRDGVKIWESI